MRYVAQGSRYSDARGGFLFPDVCSLHTHDVAALTTKERQALSYPNYLSATHNRNTITETSRSRGVDCCRISDIFRNSWIAESAEVHCSDQFILDHAVYGLCTNDNHACLECLNTFRFDVSSTASVLI
jgi:hypothetical protein